MKITTAPLSTMPTDVAAMAITAAITMPEMIVPQMLFNGFMSAVPRYWIAKG